MWGKGLHSGGGGEEKDEDDDDDDEVTGALDYIAVFLSVAVHL